MKVARLLARLSGAQDEDVHSIWARDIEHVVNSWAGYSFIDARFGLGKYDIWLGEELWLELAREIAEQITRSLPELGTIAARLPFRLTTGELVFVLEGESSTMYPRWWLRFNARERRFRCQLAPDTIAVPGRQHAV